MDHHPRCSVGVVRAVNGSARLSKTATAVTSVGVLEVGPKWIPSKALEQSMCRTGTSSSNSMAALAFPAICSRTAVRPNDYCSGPCISASWSRVAFVQVASANHRRVKSQAMGLNSFFEPLRSAVMFESGHVDQGGFCHKLKRLISARKLSLLSARTRPVATCSARIGDCEDSLFGRSDSFVGYYYLTISVCLAES